MRRKGGDSMKIGLAKWMLIGLSAACAGEAPVFKLGAGIGNGFGMLGAGLEMETPDVALLVGFGHYPAADHSIWDLGVRRYFRKQGSAFRPSITISYAPVKVISYYSIPLNIQDGTIVMGPNLIAGLDQRIDPPGRISVSYGLGVGYPIYLEKVKSDYEDAGATLPARNIRVAFSLGIKYRL